MSLYKGNTLISGKTITDTILSPTSENSIANKAVYEALQGRLALTGGTMTGDITMGANKISFGGSNLDGDGSHLYYGGNEIPMPTFEKVTLSSTHSSYGWTGSAYLYRYGDMRMLNIYLAPKLSAGCYICQLAAYDCPPDNTYNSGFCTSNNYKNQSILVPKSSTDWMRFTPTDGTASVFGSMIWFVG